MTEGEPLIASDPASVDDAYHSVLLERAMERSQGRMPVPSPEPELSVPRSSPLPRGPLDPDAGILPLTPTNASAPRRNSRRRPSARPPYLRQKPKTNKATFLYRFYDADDVLLYVGITDNLAERTWSHARASTWMEFAVRSTVERYLKRSVAEEREIAAIRGEGPLFNLAYNDGPDGDRRVVDYLIEHDRRDLLRADVSRG